MDTVAPPRMETTSAPAWGIAGIAELAVARFTA
jgi:hypothetical protein